MDSDDVTCEVVITAPDAEWLAALGRALIEEGLCAGSHLTEIRSVYRWQGEIVDKPEARLALHTRASLVPEITAFVAERHPYQVPCVVAWPISDGNPEYLAWIISETREPQPAGWLTCRRRPSASRSPGLPPPSSRRSGSAGSAS